VIPYKIVYLRPYFRDHLFCEIASVWPSCFPRYNECKFLLIKH
jgi:hypothetical protein